MASIQLKPPQPFDFSKPDEWPRWKKRYEQYRRASGLAAEDDMRQVSTLLYCLGQEVDDEPSATGISEEEHQKYDKVMEKLEDHFKVLFDSLSLVLVLPIEAGALNYSNWTPNSP